MATPTSATLGEQLTRENPIKPFRFTRSFTMAVTIGLFIWYVSDRADIGIATLGAVFIGLVIRHLRQPRHENLLALHDRHGILSKLSLSVKTAVIDGSNIYHFGLDKNIGPMPLGALIAALRSEGYQILCFFDANIYFTLRDHGDLPVSKGRFSPHMLEATFDLKPHETFVVPSGLQADVFVIESIKNLPFSFAVTNDRFRDYHPQYPFLSDNKNWRKGVSMKGRNLLLYNHKFKYPLQM